MKKERKREGTQECDLVVNEVVENPEVVSSGISQGVRLEHHGCPKKQKRECLAEKYHSFHDVSIIVFGK